MLERERSEDSRAKSRRSDDGAIGGMLSDEPGLGKSLTTLSLLLEGKANANGLPSLIVSPTPVIAAQWLGEVERFTVRVKVVHYRGPPTPYDEAVAAAMVKELSGAHLVLTDLGVIRKEFHYMNAQAAGRSKTVAFVSPLYETRWRRVVVDEVQDVEGQTSAAATTLRALTTQQRWGVSGTPITSNGLDALKGLAIFLTLRPFSDPQWWAANVDITSSATNSSKKPSSSSRKRAASSSSSSSSSSAQSSSSSEDDPLTARLELLKEFATLHMWRSRQQDVRSMPPQIYLKPLIVHASQAEFAVLYPKMADFVAVVGLKMKKRRGEGKSVE
jgi:hypothetical protein